MVFSSGHCHLPESPFNHLNDIRDDIIVGVRNLIVVDVPCDGALFSVDGFVGDACVVWVQLETGSL
jgi:hypothetical protein